MFIDDEDKDKVPRRFRTLRPDPLRDVLPWVVVAVGVVLVVRGLFNVSQHGGPQQLLVGVGLAVLGVIVYVINRWQARHGH